MKTMYFESSFSAKASIQPVMVFVQVGVELKVDVSQYLRIPLSNVISVIADFGAFSFILKAGEPALSTVLNPVPVCFTPRTHVFAHA